MSAEFIYPGSARASRAAFGVLAKCSSNVGTTLQREDVSGEGTENSTRGACALQT